MKVSTAALLGSGLMAGAAAAVPGPANVVELECALHQAAFEHGSARVASNLGSLHDALNLGNCSSVLPAATVAANRAAILASPSRPGAAASAPAATGGATVFVVATDGDDIAGDGSVAKPFASLQCSTHPWPPASRGTNAACSPPPAVLLQSQLQLLLQPPPPGPGYRLQYPLEVAPLQYAITHCSMP